MNRETKIRLSLFGGAFAIVLTASVFMWLINDNIDPKTIAVLSILSVVMLALFFFTGNIFGKDNQIQSNLVTIMIVCVLVFIQLALEFKTYGTQMAQFRLSVFNRSLTLVDMIDENEELDCESILRAADDEEFDYLTVCDTEGNVLFSSDIERTGSRIDDDKALSFVLYSGHRLVVRSSDDYESALSREALISQLTLFATLLLFSVEFSVFVIRKISNSNTVLPEGQKVSPAILSGVRQVAFIFYFVSRLCASFIPTLAKSLPYSGPAISENFLAALPQTAETAFVCISVFLSSAFLEKKGWKTPFMTGLGCIFVGTAGCLISKSLIPFVASRAVIGFGYGFCWMTLRSIALLGSTEEERLMGFSMLNAGLYAGMFCGSTVGSILADKFSYDTVFILSVALIAACGINIISMGNCYLPREEAVNDSKDTRMSIGQIFSVGAFVVLMIAPICIFDSYSSYFLPLFYEEIGRGVLDVGRVQLLYGMIIVYLGPLITRFVSRRVTSPLTANCLFIGIEVVGLILVGISGSFAASVIAMVLIGLGDSFGFGVQNSYYMNLPANRRIGSGKALMHLSLIKKLIEMTGPTVFALALSARSGGILTLGIVFAAFTVIYVIYSAFTGKGSTEKI